MPPVGEVVVFPDPVALAVTAIKGLGAHLAGAKVISRVPSTRPARFVLVRRVGGILETFATRQATLTVEAFAADEIDAANLCGLACAVLYAQDGDLFGCYEIAGPAELPDPTSDSPRVTATVGVRVRGTTLA